MRIMLLGAGGFIGRHILSELLVYGHDVVGIARSAKGLEAAFPQASFIEMDLARSVAVEDWHSRLAGIDIVINAAGLLRGRDMDAVHVGMMRALCAAAAQTSIKHIVLISAISARPDVLTDYSISKLAGEAVLRAGTVNWTILRPSLVYGDGSYGGTSLMRGLAGLPWVIPMPGAGDFAFTPIHVRDLARAVRTVCDNDVPCCQTLEPVGPETVTLREMLVRYRAWLGIGPARCISVPLPLVRLLGRIGDLTGDGPVASNSLDQMIAGNAGDSAAFSNAIGFAPRRLADALRDRPAQVQDRWHARLFFVAPALRIVLVAMWLASACLGLFNGSSQTLEFVHGLGLSPSWAAPLQIGSSILDIAVAAILWFDRSAARATLVQMVVVLGYTLALSLALPLLWLDPLGPLLKNLPVMLAIAIYGAIGDKR